MSGITGLAEMGSIIIESIDAFHFKAVFVDSQIASKIWHLKDTAREVINDINALVLANSEEEVE